MNNIQSGPRTGAEGRARRSAPGGSARRHQAIVQLVRGGAVRSQEELAQRLRQRGIAVAQPTLSRDLRELGLIKTPGGYAEPGASPVTGTPAETRPARMGRVLRGFVLSVQAAGTLVVVKTPPAAAQPVARAVDEAGLPEVAGTVAGDDTVFVAARSERAAHGLERRLAALAGAEEGRRRA